ncbi:MAG: hypothetical protein HQL66_03745 [Magnetococcales bacterium]|nr:hypothetical protein [Magnetococcales bacterium]
MGHPLSDLHAIIPEAAPTSHKKSDATPTERPQKPLTHTLGPLLAGKPKVEVVVDPANPNLIVDKDR